MKKTAVKEMLDIVQMDFNNGVEISTGVVLSMLKKALGKETKQRQEDTNHGYSQGYDDGSEGKEPMRPSVK